jgi:hypothetical protein
VSDAPAVPRKRRRWLRWTLGVLAVLGLVAFLLFLDEGLEPADDLMPNLEAVAWDDTNGWKRLLDFKKRYPQSSWAEMNRLDEAIEMKRELRLEDWQKLILPEKELVEIEAIAARPVFQSRIEDEPEAAAFSGGADFSELRLRLQATARAAIEENSFPSVLRCLHRRK